jgi:hypothetical protein
MIAMMRGRVSWLMVGVVLTVLVSGLVGRNIWTGAQQQEIEVCPSYQGSCPYTSIAAAVRDAPDGATIVIWPASYNEMPIDITKALTFKVKKRGSPPYLAAIYPKITSRTFDGLIRIAVNDKNKWVSFIGDSESRFIVRASSSVKVAVFYIRSNARFSHVVVSGDHYASGVIYTELWDGMKVEFSDGNIGGGKEWGLLNSSYPRTTWVTVTNSLINANGTGIWNLVDNVSIAGNEIIGNGTGVYAGESEGLGRAWIENNSFQENGWGIFAKTIYNIVQCRNNTFSKNQADMNNVAAEVCR